MLFPKFAARRQIGFLSLPGELRNEIYEYVYKTTTTGLRKSNLVPSAESLSNLNLLYTCRQIYWEASHMAYSQFCQSLSTTNRWHRDDLQTMRDHLIHRLDVGKYWLTSLHLITAWTHPHTDADGVSTYLCSVLDYENFIWNVLDLFEDVERIKIDVPHGSSNPVSFARTLQSSIDLTIRANRRTSIGSLASNTSVDASMNWTASETVDDGLVLFGKRDRLIHITCQMPIRL